MPITIMPIVAFANAKKIFMEIQTRNVLKNQKRLLGSTQMALRNWNFSKRRHHCIVSVCLLLLLLFFLQFFVYIFSEFAYDGNLEVVKFLMDDIDMGNLISRNFFNNSNSNCFYFLFLFLFHRERANNCHW